MARVAGPAVEQHNGLEDRNEDAGNASAGTLRDAAIAELVRRPLGKQMLNPTGQISAHAAAP